MKIHKLVLISFINIILILLAPIVPLLSIFLQNEFGKLGDSFIFFGVIVSFLIVLTATAYCGYKNEHKSFIVSSIISILIFVWCYIKYVEAMMSV